MYPATHLHSLISEEHLAVPPLDGITVLVVEDCPAMNGVIRAVCTRAGARVRQATNLRAAWFQLRKNHPDVAVIDIQLPDGSGLDLVRGLTSTEGPKSNVLAISAFADIEQNCLSCGADRFLLKPFNSLSVIADAVRDVACPVQRKTISVGARAPDLDALIRELDETTKCLAAGARSNCRIDRVIGHARLMCERMSDPALTGTVRRLEALQRSGETTCRIAELWDQLDYLRHYLEACA
ncbi:response regulator [Palleronia caenipelagi]|nr:response regulator [Palleronia caenipelagi]